MGNDTLRTLRMIRQIADENRAKGMNDQEAMLAAIASVSPPQSTTTIPLLMEGETMPPRGPYRPPEPPKKL